MKLLAIKPSTMHLGWAFFNGSEYVQSNQINLQPPKKKILGPLFIFKNKIKKAREEEKHKQRVSRYERSIQNFECRMQELRMSLRDLVFRFKPDQAIIESSKSYQKLKKLGVPIAGEDEKRYKTCMTVISETLHSCNIPGGVRAFDHYLVKRINNSKLSLLVPGMKCGKTEKAAVLLGFWYINFPKNP